MPCIWTSCVQLCHIFQQFPKVSFRLLRSSFLSIPTSFIEFWSTTSNDREDERVFSKNSNQILRKLGKSYPELGKLVSEPDDLPCWLLVSLSIYPIPRISLSSAYRRKRQTMNPENLDCAKVDAAPEAIMFWVAWSPVNIFTLHILSISTTVK